MHLSSSILRSAARRRAGLHVWLGCSAGDESSFLELPHDASAKEMSLSIGVNSLTLFSVGSSKVWHVPLYFTHSMRSAWKSASLPPMAMEGSRNGREKVQEVVSGLSHSLVLSDNGQVYSTGAGYFGQTGIQSVSTELDRVGSLERNLVRQVVCGLDHTLFLLDNGEVLACGWSADGQTGSGSVSNRSGQLTRVDLGSNKASSLASHSDSSFALTDEGKVFGWGNNEYKQLGVVSEEPQIACPQLVDCSNMDGMVTAITAGGSFVAFLTVEGSVYVAGSSIDAVSSQLLRHGTGLLRCIHCGKTSRGGKVVKVAAGLNYLLALTSSSTGRVWGKLKFPNHPQMMHHPTEFEIGQEVIHLASGPLGVAALVNSDNSKLFTFLGNY